MYYNARDRCGNVRRNTQKWRNVPKRSQVLHTPSKGTGTPVPYRTCSILKFLENEPRIVLTYSRQAQAKKRVEKITLLSI